MNKMQVRKNFMKVWKNNYNVLTVSLYSIILVVVEEIMEIEFKCPRKESLKKWYVFSYFFCPAFIVFFLSLISNPACIPWARCVRKCSCCRKSEVVFKAFLLPLIWCVILLCDGRYIGCVASRNEGNSTQNATRSGAAEIPNDFYVISQVVGLVSLTAVVVLYSLYYMYPFWFCCNYGEGYWREELETLLEEKARKYLEEMKEEGVEKIMDEEVKPSLQHIRFWKNLDLRNVVAKIREVVEPVVRDIWASRKQAVERSVPLTSCTDRTTAQPTAVINTSF